MTSPTGTAGSRVVAGRYRLTAPLGSGGMGTVWRAVDEVLGRPVAVKEVVFPHGLSDVDRDVLRERTRREARAAAKLDHPSAVTVYDVVEDDGTPYLVMELVEARTLSDLVKNEGPLTPRRAGEVGLAVLGALRAAHARGIVHRDVKPGNVLLGTSGRVVLTDFGIATSSGDSSITSTGMLLGSPSYIAPERARGQQPGPASDLWSLGATLFTAVEGRPPYDAGDPLSTVTAVVTGQHAPFVAAGPLQPVIEGLLARDPAERLDAETAQVMLEQVVRGADPGPAPRPAPPPQRPHERAAGTAALPAGGGQAAAHPAERPQEQPAPARPARPPRPASPGTRARSGVSAAAAVVAALVFLAATVGGGLWLLSAGGSDPAPTAAPGATASTSPSATPSPSPSATPQVQRPAGVPADWERYTHPTQGWTLFHPPSYEVSDRGDLKQFRDPQTRYTLRVDVTDSPRASALQAWQEYSPQLATSLAQYQEQRLEEVEFRGWDAADLEFTYTDSGADLRVLDRTFIVDGTGYALYWQTTEDKFAASLPEFERLAAAFVPAP